MPSFSRSEAARTFERHRYVDSYGAEIPIDHILFEPGHEREHDCALCGNLHDHIILWQFNVLRETKKKTNMFICRECQVFVKQMMLITYPHLLEEELHNDDPDYRLYKEQKTLPAVETRSRINAFNMSRTFVHSVDRYYTFLKFDVDLYAQETIGKCYGCHEIPGARHICLQVPVNGNATHLTGGDVPICRSCEYDLYGDHESYDAPNAVVQRCPECYNFYKVDMDEAKYRQNTNATGLNLCPGCAYKQIDRFCNNQNSLWHDSSTMSSPRNKPMDRFMFHKCDSCETEVVVDLSIKEEFLAGMHIRRDKFYCKSCINLSTFKANDNKNWIHYKDNIYIILTKVGKYWTYKIVAQGPPIKPRTIVKSVPDLTKDCVLAAMIAWQECAKLVNSKQTELWDIQS